MNMSLFTAMFLLLQFLFRRIYRQFFEQISHLDLLLSVNSFVLSPEEATEVFSKITQYLQENACVGVSF